MAVKQVTERTAIEDGRQIKHAYVQTCDIGIVLCPVAGKQNKPNEDIHTHYKIGNGQETLWLAVWQIRFRMGNLQEEQEYGKSPIDGAGTLHNDVEVMFIQVHILLDTMEFLMLL